MVSTSTKIGHGLAKVLGIDLNYRNETGSDRVTRGESLFSIDSADTYVEHEPTTLEWLREYTPSGQDIAHYFASLFPFVHWITRYNLQWLIGDLVAGMYNKPSHKDPTDLFRYHCRLCRYTSEYGLRQVGPTCT